MTKKETYIADDGKEFATEAACVEYEKYMKKSAIETRLNIRVLNEDSLPILRSLGFFNPETRYWGFSPKCNADMDAMRKYIADETDMVEDTSNSDAFVPNHVYIAVLDWDAGDEYYFTDFNQFCASIDKQLKRIQTILG